MQNIFFKVVRKNGECSVLAEGKFKMIYKDGECVKAPANTFGFMVFQTVDQAENFIERIKFSIDSNSLKIKKIKTDNAKAPEPICYVSAFLTEFSIKKFYRGFSDVLRVLPPKGTFICQDGFVIGDL